MEKYYAKIEDLGDGFIVSFRDIPEALTQGKTLSETVDMAQDAARTALSFYDESGKSRPTPSRKRPGEYKIYV